MSEEETFSTTQVIDSLMERLIDLLPILAILLVVFSMSAVDVVIIGDPLRVLSNIPILFVILLWCLATFRIRRRGDVH